MKVARTDYRVLLLTALVLAGACVLARAQGKAFDVSNMPVGQRIPLQYDSKNSKLVSGIMKRSPSTVVIRFDENGWIQPFGAGIFVASEAQPLPTATCAIVSRSSIALLPVMPEMSFVLTSAWHESDIDAPIGYYTTGRMVGVPYARPSRGGYKTIAIKGTASSAPVLLSDAPGSLANESTEIPKVGRVAIFFYPDITWSCSALVTSEQLSALRVLLSEASPKKK